MNKHIVFVLTLLLPAYLNIIKADQSAEPYVEIQVLHNGVPLVISCNSTAAGRPIQWYKDNESLKNSDSFEIAEDGSSLKIAKTVEASLGNYTCKYVNSTEILSFYNVISKPLVKFSSDDAPIVVEGEKLHLTCVTSTLYDPNITWIFRDQEYQQSQDRITILKDEATGVEGAVLIVDNMQMEEFGNVTCRVKFIRINGGVFVDAVTYVRVKDKLAALWPFLGICAQVILLSAIIIIYEKKRDKTELDDSDTDQGPETKPTPKNDSDVRQRK